jgi:TRAP transporter TAXI family solute receptor
MRRHILLGLAFALACLAAGLVIWQWTSAPTTLRIAVGPQASEDARLVAALSQLLVRERHPIRLKLVATGDVGESADAVRGDRADLGVIRSDVNPPTNAQTVAILHQDAAVLMSLPDRGVSEISDLPGRTVGVVRKLPANAKLLDRILRHYDVVTATTAEFDTPEAAAAALREGAVDAVFVIGAPAGRTLSDAVTAVTQAGGGPPVFIPVGEAEAVAQRGAGLEEIEIIRGAFGGSPPRPGEPFKTVAVSHRLVAETSLDDGLVSELTELIFTARPALATEVPAANLIEAPETSKSSSMPVHSGAAAYYDGEVLTFMERYGDWVYITVMVGSILGSAVAGVAGAATANLRRKTMSLLDELLAIVTRARHAGTEAELEALEAEADEVLGQALSKASAEGIDQTVMVALFLGLDQARRAIAEQRKHLADRPPLPRAAE